MKTFSDLRFSHQFYHSFIFWDLAPYSLFEVNWHFQRTCQLHLQVHRIRQARNQREAEFYEVKSPFEVSADILWATWHYACIAEHRTLNGNLPLASLADLEANFALRIKKITFIYGHKWPTPSDILLMSQSWTEALVL
jgi:hypothetical protein